jgi:hypothetical protein
VTPSSKVTNSNRPTKVNLRLFSGNVKSLLHPTPNWGSTAPIWGGHDDQQKAYRSRPGETLGLLHDPGAKSFGFGLYHSGFLDKIFAIFFCGEVDVARPQSVFVRPEHLVLTASRQAKAQD